MEFLSKAFRAVFSEDSQQQTGTLYNDELLPFPFYAACRLLRSSPAKENKGSVFKALLMIAKNYIDANVEGISDSITKYKLEMLLSDIAKTSACHLPNMELLRDLMLLLERLLLEYLSENWDTIEHVLEVNRDVDVHRSKSHSALLRFRSSSSASLASKERARQNWQRAYRVAIKSMVLEKFGVQRTVLTMTQLFKTLNSCRSPTAQNNSVNETKRAPILLLLGGGMAAGKSTVRQIIGSDSFWSKVGKDAVVVEADAIKNQDIVFHCLQDRLGKDDPSLSQLVHEYSTSAAEAMLVRAINEQKDIIFDGTMTWLPFVEQTISMARDHLHNYKRGPGYYQDKNGQTHENYWELDPEDETDTTNNLPYRIELVGVTCSPTLAVARGIWRKIRTGRGVPVESQLRSHRLFSQNFEAIAKMVDSATLYHTGAHLTTFTHTSRDIMSSLKVICHSSSVTRGELLVNPKAMEEFSKNRDINDQATSVKTLYTMHASSKRAGNKHTLERTFTSSINASPSVGSLRSMLVEANRISAEEA